MFKGIYGKNKYYLYAGIGGFVVFLAIGLFFVFAPENMIADYEDGIRLPVFLVFAVLSILSIFISIYQFNWKIEVGKAEFSFTNFFGRKRSYKYESVKVELLSRCTKFYHDEKHIVSVLYLQENWDALEKAIESWSVVHKV